MYVCVCVWVLVKLLRSVAALSPLIIRETLRWTDGQTTAANRQLIAYTRQVYRLPSKSNLSDFSHSLVNLLLHPFLFLSCRSSCFLIDEE